MVEEVFTGEAVDAAPVVADEVVDAAEADAEEVVEAEAVVDPMELVERSKRDGTKHF